MTSWILTFWSFELIISWLHKLLLWKLWEQEWAVEQYSFSFLPDPCRSPTALKIRPPPPTGISSTSPASPVLVPMWWVQCCFSLYPFSCSSFSFPSPFLRVSFEQSTLLCSLTCVALGDSVTFWSVYVNGILDSFVHLSDKHFSATCVYVCLRLCHAVHAFIPTPSFEAFSWHFSTKPSCFLSAVIVSLSYVYACFFLNCTQVLR